MNDNSIMVSIRCLVYNHEPFLRQCLDGFVMQQTNFRFEAIVHDDVSTDGSAAIIREYAAKYPDIIKPIFETENQYSKHDGSLRRIMNAHTRGKYVAYCEGDDYWTDPLKLQKQVDFLESHPDYSMCFHKAKVIAQDGREYVDYFSKLEEREYKAEEILTRWIIPTASMLRRRNVQVPSHEDFNVGDIIIHAACVACGRVFCLSGEMSVYRLHAGGWGAHPYNYLEHAIKQLPCRLAMLEAFPSRIMKPLKKLVAYRCYLWFRNYRQYHNAIPAEYILKALLYCNTELLKCIVMQPLLKILRKLGFKIKYTNPE